jgi:hypothetical protein
MIQAHKEAIELPIRFPVFLFYRLAESVSIPKYHLKHKEIIYPEIVVCRILRVLTRSITLKISNYHKAHKHLAIACSRHSDQVWLLRVDPKTSLEDLTHSKAVLDANMEALNRE